MKVCLSSYPFYVLFITLPILLVDGSTFFSAELPPCEGEMYGNHLSKCKDESLIIPDGRRVYKNYYYESWFGQNKHEYGKVYVADGAKWKAKKDQVGYFNPETQQTEVLHNHSGEEHFVLLAIDDNGNITYGNGLEYKADGTVKTKHWLDNTVNLLQESSYKCPELPCSFSIESGKTFTLELPLAFYMDSYGDYKVLKNLIKGKKRRSVEAEYQLEVYKPTGSGNYLEYTWLEPGEQAFYEDVYYRVNGFPKEWKDSYDTWEKFGWE